MISEPISQMPLRPLIASTDRELAAKKASRRAVVLLVMTRAHNPREARRLLDMLGIHPREGLAP